MSTTTVNRVSTVNGVDLDTLLETIGAIENDSELGIARFRASNIWMGGNRNQSTVTGFYGAKMEIPHAQQFEMEADEPPILAGKDEAPNPVEHLLHSLAACLTTSMVAHAAVQGIAIDEIESTLEGDIDLNGFLGLDSTVPKGFSAIRVDFQVKTESDDLDTIASLAEFSPVFNTITQGSAVDVSVKRK